MSDRDRLATARSQIHVGIEVCKVITTERTTKDAPFQGRLQIKGRGAMVLRGLLSNHDLAASLHSLTVALRDQPHRPDRERAVRLRYAGDRRRFGSVGDAVVAVLRDSGGAMKLQAIHKAVEKKLGGSVSNYSVQDYLRRHTDSPEALFEHTTYGHYAMRNRGRTLSVGD